MEESGDRAEWLMTEQGWKKKCKWIWLVKHTPQPNG
jgi:hypothetical protein